MQSARATSPSRCNARLILRPLRPCRLRHPHLFREALRDARSMKLRDTPIYGGAYLARRSENVISYRVSRDMLFITLYLSINARIDFYLFFNKYSINTLCTLKFCGVQRAIINSDTSFVRSIKIRLLYNENLREESPVGMRGLKGEFCSPRGE